MSVYLFSGFHDGFASTLADFASEVRGDRRVALLLQGGEGWERYLDAYFTTSKAAGLTLVDPVVPEAGTVQLSEASLAAISKADGLFIGGGVMETCGAVEFSPLHGSTNLVQGVTP